MTMNMNNLYKLSFVVQKLSILSRNTAIPTRLFRTSCYCRTEDTKDYDVQTQVSHRHRQRKLISSETFPLVKIVHECPSREHIFRVIRKNATNMKGIEAYEILKALKSLNKSNGRREDKISSAKEFAMLCDILEKQKGELPIGCVVRSLDILNYFHVPSSSNIIEYFLKIIRDSIHDLNIRQLSRVNYTLSKCQKTPSVEALLIAIPIILHTYTRSGFEIKNVDSLVRHLRSIDWRQPEKGTVSRILTTLAEVDESSITPEHAKIIMKTLLKNFDDTTSMEVLRKCQKILTASVDNMHPNDLIEIVDVISYGVCTGNQSFYNDSLLDACALTTISRNLGFNTAIRILSSINNMLHTNNSVLDYIAAKCFEDENMAKKITQWETRALIAGIAIADYKPVFWGALESILLNENQLNMHFEKLLTVGIHLAAIDCYWPKLLEKVFSDTHIKSHWKQKARFLLLHSAVKSFYPEYDGPWPSENALGSYKECPTIPKPTFPLQLALESALGGPQYVLTNLCTPLGNIIDHVVIMRKGGFPIALNTCDQIVSNIDDLKPPQNSQVILLLHIGQHGYARNTQRLTGDMSLILRILQTQTNHTLIQVKHDIWKNLSEAERVRYISQALRLRCDELSAVLND